MTLHLVIPTEASQKRTQQGPLALGPGSSPSEPIRAGSLVCTDARTDIHDEKLLVEGPQLRARQRFVGHC